MTVRKSSAKKKSSSKKASSKKAATKKPAVKKKAAAKKGTAKKAAPTKESPKKDVAEKEAPKPRSGFSSMQATMGHVFQLRPKVSTGFRPDDFRRARQLLADESYKSVGEAARAVAERALDLTREKSGDVLKPKRM